MRQEIDEAFKLALVLGVALALVLFIVQGCGQRVYSNDTRAVEIPGPVNTICFAVLENGRAVGGNCLWAR